MRKGNLEDEVGRFMEVYNEAWGDNWGFVPITEAEVAFQAKNLKPVLDERLGVDRREATARWSAPRSPSPTSTRRWRR